MPKDDKKKTSVMKRTANTTAKKAAKKTTADAPAKKTTAKATAKKAGPRGQSLQWADTLVRQLDPAKPSRVIAEYKTVDELAEAIAHIPAGDGAALRAAGALGVMLAAVSLETLNESEFYKKFTKLVRVIVGSREPADANLVWGVNRMMSVAADRRNRGIEAVKAALREEIGPAVAEASALEKKTATKRAAAKPRGKKKAAAVQIPATIEWVEGKVRMIDQSKLPLVGEVIEATTADELIVCIQSMKVRGAPVLGVAGAMGVALIANSIDTANETEFYRLLTEEVRRLIVARPTAINLVWGINRMMNVAAANRLRGIDTVRKAMDAEVAKIVEEDKKRNRKMAESGAKLVKDGDRILTHCNAGSLATAGYGTALGVVFAAFEDGKDIKVYVDETRPCLQGARLSTWELMMAGVETILIVDSAAGLLMREGEITKVFVGADRIAANGDVANKIGTYPVSVIAKENGVPFYVVAPTSTVDMGVAEGRKIPIELRDPAELTMVGETQVAPDGVQVYNPAFDITPAENITAIITEKGVAKPPLDKSLAKLMSKK